MITLKLLQDILPIENDINYDIVISKNLFFKLGGGSGFLPRLEYMVYFNSSDYLNDDEFYFFMDKKRKKLPINDLLRQIELKRKLENFK